MRDQLVQYDIDHGSIFDAVTESTQAHVQQSEQDLSFLPATALRAEAPILPRASELQAVRHFTRLSQKNFSIDTNFYPLGSCTMKYNPRVCNELALAPGLVDRHPLARPQLSQGFLSAMYDLQEMLSDVSGLPGVALSPMAGAQGEYAGVAMIRAYHMKNGDEARTEIIVPDAAHGTNPATAVMCGFKVKEIPTLDDGDVDIDALKAIVGPQTAGIMLTNPSTVGVFERKISEIAKIVHDAGGLLYYDGANLNAILGHTKPGDMGFDVMHMNLHKTFSTPHGGGGPGAGSIAVGERLLPFMPTPIVIEEDGQYRLQYDDEREDSIGQLSAFAGNAGVLIRAYVYMKLLGDEGMRRVGRFSSLNANYLMHKLKDAGFQLAYPTRRASHEFIVTLKKEKSDYGLTALDVAKGLLDYGFHAPTTYFPIHVPECLLIEPTETESKAEIDKFVDVMVKILDIAKTDIEHLKGAPWTLPNRRFDEVKAVKELNIRWQADA